MVRELRLGNLAREECTEVPCFLCLLLTPDSLTPLGSDTNGKTARKVAGFLNGLGSTGLSGFVSTAERPPGRARVRIGCWWQDGWRVLVTLSKVPEGKWQGSGLKDSNEEQLEMFVLLKSH